MSVSFFFCLWRPLLFQYQYRSIASFGSQSGGPDGVDGGWGGRTSANQRSRRCPCQSLKLGNSADVPPLELMESPQGAKGHPSKGPS